MKRIAVLGTGYVGLVSGAGISDFGHQVTCCDIDTNKIEQLQKGIIPIYEPGLESLVARNVKAGRLKFSLELKKAITEADVVFIAVGTPMGNGGMADLRAVEAVAETIGTHIKGYTVICTKSTVPIGTGDRIQSIIRSNNSNGARFDYVSNPEFLREGAAVKDFMHPDRIVIGASGDKAFEVMEEVYRPLYIRETPLVLTTVETAETIKYACNAFLALKISYINEISTLCDAVGADVHTVAKAMGIDGRISPKFLHPGPGFGGSCFPKDSTALVSMAEKAGVTLNTVIASLETNEFQKELMFKKLQEMTGPVEGKTVAVLGLSFKPETDDIRESPAVNMIRNLIQNKAGVNAYDPIAGDNMKSAIPEITLFDSWESAVRDADAVVIMTEWNEFRGMDLGLVKKLLKSPVVLDTRNILNIEELKRLGFTFDNVGRKVLTG